MEFATHYLKLLNEITQNPLFIVILGLIDAKNRALNSYSFSAGIFSTKMSKLLEQTKDPATIFAAYYNDYITIKNRV